MQQVEVKIVGKKDEELDMKVIQELKDFLKKKGMMFLGETESKVTGREPALDAQDIIPKYGKQFTHNMTFVAS